MEQGLNDVKLCSYGGGSSYSVVQTFLLQDITDRDIMMTTAHTSVKEFYHDRCTDHEN